MQVGIIAVDLVHLLGQDHQHHTSSSPLLCIGTVSAATYRMHLQRAQGRRKRRPHEQNGLQSQLVSSELLHDASFAVEV